MDNNQQLTANKVAIRESTRQSLKYLDILLLEMKAESEDYVVLEKISVLVGDEIPEEVFFSCLESCRRNDKRVDNLIGYFIGALNRHVALQPMLKSIFVR